MAQSSLADLPEVFLSSAERSAAISRAAKRDQVRKLGPRLYTTNVKDPPEAVVRRNLWQVVGLLFPQTVVSHRSALEARPTPGGTVFLSGPYDRLVELPGLRIRQMRGPGPLAGDARFVRDLWIASPERATLECLAARRVRGAESPALPRQEIEGRLEALIRRAGKDAANGFRDRARALVPALGGAEAYAALDAAVGALLGSRRAALIHPTADE